MDELSLGGSFTPLELPISNTYCSFTAKEVSLNPFGRLFDANSRGPLHGIAFNQQKGFIAKGAGILAVSLGIKD